MYRRGEYDPRPSLEKVSYPCECRELWLFGLCAITAAGLFLGKVMVFLLELKSAFIIVCQIPDRGVRDMVLHMIQLDPELRLSSQEYLQTWAPNNFPSYFSPLLHNFFSCIVPLDPDTRVSLSTMSRLSKFLALRSVCWRICCPMFAVLTGA